MTSGDPLLFFVVVWMVVGTVYLIATNGDAND
jgi:hypothetical protein